MKEKGWKEKKVAEKMELIKKDLKIRVVLFLSVEWGGRSSRGSGPRGDEGTLLGDASREEKKGTLPARKHDSQRLSSLNGGSIGRRTRHLMEGGGGDLGEGIEWQSSSKWNCKNSTKGKLFIGNCERGYRVESVPVLCEVEGEVIVGRGRTRGYNVCREEERGEVA